MAGPSGPFLPEPAAALWGLAGLLDPESPQPARPVAGAKPLPDAGAKLLAVEEPKAGADSKPPFWCMDVGGDGDNTDFGGDAVVLPGPADGGLRMAELGG